MLNWLKEFNTYCETMVKKNLFMILSRFPYPLDKGDKLRAFHQLSYLSKFFQVELIILESKPKSNENRTPVEALCHQIHYLPVSNTARYSQSLWSWFRGEPIQVGYFYSRAVHRSMKDLFSQHYPDVVYFQLCRTAKYHTIFKGRKVLDFQDAFSMNYERLAQTSSLLWRWFYAREARCMQRFERGIREQFNATTIISATDRDSIHADIQVIPNGVDIEFFKPMPKVNKSFDLFFVGNLSYHPNQQAVHLLLHDIFPKVKQQLPMATLHIAGADMPEEFRKYHGDGVHISGWVDDVVLAYNQASLFVAPLFSGAGLQNKVLEALSCGIPVLTTPIVNASLQATPNQEIFLAEAITDFADRIIHLLQNTQLLDDCGEAGRYFIEKNYLWGNANQQLLKVLQGEAP